MTVKSFVLGFLIPFSAFAQPVAFQHARIIDGKGGPAVEDAILVIDGPRITAVGKAGQVQPPKGARVIDASGKTIMPGLIVSHGHVGVVMDAQNRPDAYNRDNIVRQLQQYEKYGVTGVLALGLNRDLGYDLRDEQRKGGVPGASLFVAGRGIGAPGGAPPLPVAPDQVYRPQSVDEAIAEVKEMAAHRPDMVKVWVDDIFGKLPKLPRDIFAAVIQEAHRNKLRVAAHVFYLEDAKALAAVGVDALAHSVRDRPIDDALITTMKAKRMVYIPTLNVDESSFMFYDDPALLQDPFLADAMGEAQKKYLQSPEYRKKVESDPNLATNRAAVRFGMQNLKAVHDAGIRVAFGTDSGGNPFRIQGWGEHRELELMVRSGLKPMDAIVSATSRSAEFLGASDRGVLAPGKRADFVVLAANPLDDIRNTRQLVAVWNGGKEIKPAAH